MKYGKDYLVDKTGIITLEQLIVDDIVNRTESSMPQAHVFLATELSLKAQKFVKKL